MSSEANHKTTDAYGFSSSFSSSVDEESTSAAKIIIESTNIIRKALREAFAQQIARIALARRVKTQDRWINFAVGDLCCSYATKQLGIHSHPR